MAVEIASPAALVHRDMSSARLDGAGCCRFDRQTHVVTQRQRLSTARRSQLEPVLRAGDELCSVALEQCRSIILDRS